MIIKTTEATKVLIKGLRRGDWFVSGKHNNNYYVVVDTNPKDPTCCRDVIIATRLFSGGLVHFNKDTEIIKINREDIDD